MKLKRLFVLRLGAVLLFSSVGCGGRPTYVKSQQRTPERVDSVSFDIIGGKDVMPIGGWWGPYEQSAEVINGNKLPNYNQEMYYQLLKEAGINTITVTPNNYADKKYQDAVRTALDIAEQYRMAYFVHDTGFLSQNSSEAQLKRIQEYVNHPACVGIHLKDEPIVSMFDSISLQYEWFDELGFHDKMLYTNLLPIYGTFSTTKDVTYEAYLRGFLEKVNTPFLSTDHYPFSEANTGTDNVYMIYREISTLRKLAQEYEIPFWGFVQAGGQWSDGGSEFYSEEYFPSEGEMTWNVNMLLAYGCKSIQYFTLIQPAYYVFVPDDDRDFNRIGLLGAAGNKNRWYYYAQKINKQVAAIDHVLMNSQNMGVIPVGNKPSTMVLAEEKLSSFRELISVKAENAIVGCFDYLGKTALYVVNNSATEKQAVEMEFDKAYAYEVIQRAISHETGGKKLSLTLECGEGVLVALH